jgi:hypothetical protein
MTLSVVGQMRLWQVTTSDIDAIERSLGAWQCTERWALGGTTPPPSLLERIMYEGVSLQYALRADDGGTRGLVQLTSVNVSDGVACLELTADPSYADTADAAIRKFIDEAFTDFPLRKLVVSAPEDDLDLVACLSTALRQVGYLRGHRRRGPGSYVGVNIYELWAEDWFCDLAEGG